MIFTEKTVTVTKAEFDKLDEYSCSLPTGTTVGKSWKRKKDYHDESKGWLHGEYVEDPDPKMIGIRWRELIIELTSSEELEVIKTELLKYLHSMGLSTVGVFIQMIPGHAAVQCDTCEPRKFSICDPGLFENVAYYVDTCGVK
jgi:hypothetical protein